MAESQNQPSELGRGTSPSPVIAPKRDGVKYDKKANRWFQSVDWGQLFLEFLTTFEPNGEFRYKTAWSFCRAKSKSTQIQRWMYSAVGPRPVGWGDGQPQPGLQVPWIADWDRLRARAAWADDESRAVISAAVKEELNAVKSARAAASFVGSPCRPLHS